MEQAASAGRGEIARSNAWTPCVDDVRLAEALNGGGLAGIWLVPVPFAVTASVHARQRGRAPANVVGLLSGVEREKVEPLAVGMP